MSRGYVIVAENTKTVDYLRCAEALAYSLKKVMPECNVTLLTDNVTSIKSKYFDKVLALQAVPTTDAYKILNDVQVYALSPYDYTIKLEADMFIPRSIEHWWDILCQREVVVSATIRNFKGQISDCRVYRKFIDDNTLPDVYNAITYFKKSSTAEQFFNVVKNITENWADYRNILKCNSREEVTTDWAYAIASHIVGVEKTTLPGFTGMGMVHMKKFVCGIPSEDWTQTLVHELLPHSLRVNTFTQMYPFHYHSKSFADTILESIHV